MKNKLSSIKGSKILIVDDKQENLELLTQILEAEGYEIAFAMDGEQAIKIATMYLPHLILLDVMMPGIDGFEFLETIKKEGLGKNPVVVVLSNQGQDEEIEKAKKLGADDYIVKASAIPSEVLEQVKKSLGM